MLYCLDTNVLIQAYRQYYAFDIAPGFWVGIREWSDKGVIGCPMNVFDEIAKSRDQLTEWARTNKDSLFSYPDEQIVGAYSEIADFVANRYEPQHIQVFLGGADPWVVAFAKNQGAVVVTLEVLNPSEQQGRIPGRMAGKIRIPNICQHFSVRWMNTFDLMRAIRLTLN